MRIALICPYSLSVPGGVQAQALGLAVALRDLGHHARVLAPCDGPPPDSMVTPLGMSVPTASNGSMAPIAPDPACALRTMHALRNEGFDVLHLHEPMVPGPTLTALVSSDVPKVGTFHAAGSSLAYNRWPWMAKRLANRLAVRVAVSEDARAAAQANIGGTYEVLYNGIDVLRTANGPSWARTKRRVLFFVGRHEPRKGLRVLLEAVSQITDDIEVWIGGTGPQTASLSSEYAHDRRISWLGRLTEAEKLARMRAADVFCAPSIEGESFGIVLLEALATGAPIVASDLDGYRNVVERDVNALLTPIGDSAAMAEAIRRVLNDRSLAQSLAANARERAQDFSMHTLAEKYVSLYQRATNNFL